MVGINSLTGTNVKLYIIIYLPFVKTKVFDLDSFKEIPAHFNIQLVWSNIICSSSTFFDLRERSLIKALQVDCCKIEEY